MIIINNIEKELEDITLKMFCINQIDWSEEEENIFDKLEIRRNELIKEIKNNQL